MSAMPVDLASPLAQPRLFCDLTQSWSDVGGGVGTYIRHKRSHILKATRHRHLLIIPGAEDRVTEEEGGRAITVTIASPHVPASPHYRLLLRNGAVRKALERFAPDLIECQDSYNLPWAAIAHRKRHPHVALVGGYFTDFPTVYVARPLSRVLGKTVAGGLGRLCYDYCGALYRRFDAVFALSENGGAARLRAHGVDTVHIVPLGVELGDFQPERRDPDLRRSLGVPDDAPLLVYVGRMDIEKKPDIVVDAFRRLPAGMNATLVLLGEGPLREQFQRLPPEARVVTRGFVRDRAELARWLASADIYVSAFGQETFGVSVVEAQASGLPVVGVASGALLDRVQPGMGRLGPVNDPAAMAANIQAVWGADRQAMGELARRHALQFSWQASMDALFGQIYSAAIASRAAQAGPIPAPSRASMQKA